MSIIIDDSLREQFRSPAEFINGSRTVGSLSAGFVRHECEQRVRRSPTICDDAHGDVIGSNAQGFRKKMAREATCFEGDWERASRA
jgi:hypothetical protein